MTRQSPRTRRNARANPFASACCGGCGGRPGSFWKLVSRSRPEAVPPAVMRWSKSSPARPGPSRNSAVAILWIRDVVEIWGAGGIFNTAAKPRKSCAESRRAARLPQLAAIASPKNPRYSRLTSGKNRHCEAAAKPLPAQAPASGWQALENRRGDAGRGGHRSRIGADETIGQRGESGARPIGPELLYGFRRSPDRRCAPPAPLRTGQGRAPAA